MIKCILFCYRYAPALRQLRQVAFVVTFPPTIPSCLATRLLEVILDRNRLKIYVKSWLIFKDFQDSLQGPKVHPKIIKDLTMPLCSSLVDIWISFKPFTPEISLVILLTVCYTIFMMLVGKIGIGSTNIPLIDIFLYSHLCNIDIISEL